MFEAEQTPLFFIRAPGYCKQKRWSKILKHRKVLEQQVHLGRKGPSFLDITDNVDYDAPA